MFSRLVVATLATGLVCLPAPAQEAKPPQPPQRPFEIDLPKQPPRLPAPATKEAKEERPADLAAGGALQAAPVPPARPTELTSAVEPEEEEASPPKGTGKAAPPAPGAEREWPRITPGQQGVAEPAVVDDSPVPPGISTDPGTSIACLPEQLKTVLNRVVAQYGAVRVTSTYRPSWRARRGSYHRRCEAVDFRVPGHRPGEVLGLVRNFEETGGRKVYWNGLIHVDTGPVRSW